MILIAIKLFINQPLELSFLILFTTKEVTKKYSPIKAMFMINFSFKQSKSKTSKTFVIGTWLHRSLHTWGRCLFQLLIHQALFTFGTKIKAFTIEIVGGHTRFAAFFNRRIHPNKIGVRVYSGRRSVNKIRQIIPFFKFFLNLN